MHLDESEREPGETLRQRGEEDRDETSGTSVISAHAFFTVMDRSTLVTTYVSFKKLPLTTINV